MTLMSQMYSGLQVITNISHDCSCSMREEFCQHLLSHTDRDGRDGGRVECPVESDLPRVSRLSPGEGTCKSILILWRNLSFVLPWVIGI